MIDLCQAMQDFIEQHPDANTALRRFAETAPVYEEAMQQYRMAMNCLHPTKLYISNSTNTEKQEKQQ